MDTRTESGDPVRTVPSASGQPALNPYVPRVLLRHLATTPDDLWWTIDGSVVFVDISGFTKLSEKLAKVGKEGAEQVTDAIEACFTDLLSVAYANEGSLIKFGGDALLLLFEGGDHVASACRSAVWMRRALRDVGRIELPGGSHLQLRMSVGVHTGTYHFFHVGGSHRELVVTGPGWTGTVGMEHVADAGEILLSSDIAAKLPPRCIGEPKGSGFLLKREPPGHHISVPDVRYEVDPDAVARCLSTAVRAHVLAGGGTPEHRQVSIAFIHYDGTDGFIADRGPEFVADGLQELLADTQAACDEYGVCFLATDADDDGGKLILTAGAPTITGNDEERMLLALRKIADKQRTIPIRIGVNRGAVFAGDIGPWYRRTYTVMGDAVNLAARLMAQATPGQIFATHEVVDASGTLFETTELEPFMVKGKAKPVEAVALGEVVGSRTRDTSLRLPLIGRAKELAELRQALAEALKGHGSLIEIVGEPGIGKTRLIEELHAEQAARVLFTTGEAFTSSTPYVIWRDLLRQVLDVSWEADDRTVMQRLHAVILDRDPELVPWLPLIAIPLDVDVPLTPEVERLADEFRQAKLHEVVGRFLAASLVEPTLMHVEDAHLMDAASGDLFTSLVSEIAKHPWLITLTRRDAETGYVAPTHERASSIELHALDRDGLVTLVEAATEEAPLLPHDVSLVVDRSGGNPQFALDLALVVRTGAMLPGSIETAALARIDALAPADRALVRRASVLGTVFHRRFLEDVLEEDGPRPDDDTWERLSEFFSDDGEGFTRFRRAVVRDAAYGGLPFRTRRSLHARIAQRFEAEYEPDETGGLLSLHYFLAGIYDKAWNYARAAATRAESQFANREAAQLFQRAIDAARRLPDTPKGDIASVHEEMGHCLRRAGIYQRAVDAFSTARSQYAASDDPLSQARVLLERSKVEDRLGRYPQALRWATRARTTIADIDTVEAQRQRAQIDAWYATVLQSSGRLADAIPWSTAAIALADEVDEPRALAQANFVLGWSDFLLGRPGIEHMEQAVAIYERLEDTAGQAHMSVNLGAAAYYAGRWDYARETWDKGRELFVTVGDASSAAISDANVAQVLADQGRTDEAEPLLRSCVRIYRASGDPYMLGSALSQLARVVCRCGYPDEAMLLFQDASRELSGAGASAEELEAQALWAEALLLAGRVDEALRRADDALVRLRSLGTESVTVPLLLRVQGVGAAARGDVETAWAKLDEALQVARERGAEFDIASAQLARARLAGTGTDVFAEATDEAGEILERLGVIAVPGYPSVAAS